MTSPIDSTPLAAFTDEFRQSLPAIMAALDATERDRADRAAAYEAYRLIHALKGAAAMVGLAALGHLFHVAEERIEGSITGTAPLTEETLAILREAMPQFSGYLDAAVAGQRLEPLALDLLRTLRQDDGPDAVAALRILLDLEAREMAWLPSERPEKPGDAAELDAGMPGLAAVFAADQDINWPEPAVLPDMAWQSPEGAAKPADAADPAADVTELTAAFAADDETGWATDLAPLAEWPADLAPLTQWPADSTPLAQGSIDPADPAPVPEWPSDLAPLTEWPLDLTLLAGPPADPAPVTAPVLGAQLTQPADLAPPAGATAESAPLAERPADAAFLAQRPASDGPPRTEPVPAAARTPEPEFDLVQPEIPAELAEIFGQEAQEHLETIARFTSSLTTESQDRDALQELRRAVHTLKGAAGVVGFKGAAQLAHRMEDLLDRLYDGLATLTPQAVRTLAASSDALNDLIVGVPDAGALRVVMKRLFGEFDGLVGGAAAPVAEAVSAAAASPEPALSAEAAAVFTPDAPSAGERRRRGVDRRVSDRRGGGQVLRVPVPRLNELVRVVSELAINRSTFEQHHLTLIEEIEELKLATARLRKVTHRLESDYEVRAFAGNTPAAGSKRTATSAGGHGFDELEFDRYTEFHLLTRELTETTSDIATISARVAGTIREFDGDLVRQGRLTREVQDKTMEFRMVPLGTLAMQLERAVRSTAESCGKLVDFKMEGEHVSLDKSLLEQMADPLLHLLRNSIDHGIEPPAGRQAAAKPPRGTITVRAFHEGTDVLIEVEDDGTGLDLDRIRRTAIAKGYMTESTVMGTDALFALIFEPGFSTADRVSEISGRGVGMDVVKSKVARLGGRVYITSRPGAGTTISARVPMTLAMTRVLLVRAGGQTFGLPLSAVVQIARPNPSAITLLGTERVLTLDGRTYPLRNLADTLGLARAADAPAAQPVLIANLSRRRIALAVDEIVNSRDAVVKTLGTHLRRVRGIWGATLLGDGTVVLILNPADLAGVAEEQVLIAKPKPRAAAARLEPYTVLIVDDSLSMRHVLSLAVKKAGWIPVSARDGLEALELIHRSPRAPDLVLLDVEMPRMDGFEFLATIRSQKGRADLPIVMLTSRSGDKHRDKATALGATDYMVKPFHEETLIRNIERLVQAARQPERRAAS